MIVAVPRIVSGGLCSRVRPVFAVANRSNSLRNSKERCPQTTLMSQFPRHWRPSLPEEHLAGLLSSYYLSVHPASCRSNCSMTPSRVVSKREYITRPRDPTGHSHPPRNSGLHVAYINNSAQKQLIKSTESQKSSGLR